MILHLFDFDGTISKSDSMFKFLRTLHKKRNFYFLLVKCIPFFLKYHLNIISKDCYKDRFLNVFLSKFSRDFLTIKANEFTKIYQNQIKSSAIEFIEDLRSNKENKICIVSASLDLWIEPLAKKMNINSISTLSKFNRSKFIGINGKNCWGEEKVVRIKCKYNINDFEEIHAYGDSKGDYQMLNLATHKRIKFFN